MVNQTDCYSMLCGILYWFYVLGSLDKLVTAFFCLNDAYSLHIYYVLRGNIQWCLQSDAFKRKDKPNKSNEISQRFNSSRQNILKASRKILNDNIINVDTYVLLPLWIYVSLYFGYVYYANRKEECPVIWCCLYYSWITWFYDINWADFVYCSYQGLLYK